MLLQTLLVLSLLTPQQPAAKSQTPTARVTPAQSAQTDTSKAKAHRTRLRTRKANTPQHAAPRDTTKAKP
jgi:hypothetical protein